MSTRTTPTDVWREPSRGTFAKSAVAGAVQTLAPARTAYRALDVKVNYLRPVTADGRDLVATGTVVHNGRRLAIATAEVVNADGDRVAIATGTTLLGSSPPPRAGADSIAEGADARIGR